MGQIFRPSVDPSPLLSIPKGTRRAFACSGVRNRADRPVVWGINSCHGDATKAAAGDQVRSDALHWRRHLYELGGRVLVLVLEQDPAQSKRACDVLRSAGIKIAGPAAHTAEAWNLANARRPSWVLVHHQDGGERF